MSQAVVVSVILIVKNHYAVYRSTERSYHFAKKRIRLWNERVMDRRKNDFTEKSWIILVKVFILASNPSILKLVY